MTQLQKIVAKAKTLKKSHPNTKWTDLIKKASKLVTPAKKSISGIKKVVAKKYAPVKPLIKKRIETKSDFAMAGVKPISYYKYETPKVTIYWKGKLQPLGIFKSAEDAFKVIKKQSALYNDISDYEIRTPDKILKFNDDGLISGVGKKKTTKKAVKKSPARSIHKDTKSHNVNIRVVSGLQNLNYLLIKEIQKTNEEIQRDQKLLDQQILVLKNNNFHYSLKERKTYLKLIEQYKRFIKEKKTHLQELKKQIK